MAVTIRQPERRALLGMPGYGGIAAGAARGFWRSTRWPNNVWFHYLEGSLLAQSCNGLWCVALNLLRAGEDVGYFAMQHSDVQPEDFWLDMAIAELEDQSLDVLSVVVPIKDQNGTTSTALARPDGSPWRAHCRLTTQEIATLPATFTSQDVGHPLLVNTGLFVCRFDPAWVHKIHFTINDRIVFDTNRQIYSAETEPEDWFFSRLLHELGLKVGVTRKIALTHRGSVEYSNQATWGGSYDREYLTGPAIPTGVPGFRFPDDTAGWLSYQEGAELAKLAAGKRVLEIGSYCGRSTICLAQTAKYVHAVDTFDGRGTPSAANTWPMFLQNIKRYGITDKVVPYCGSSQEVCRELAIDNARYDLIFIDGSHDKKSVRADIESASQLLADDGLLVFHDYRRRVGGFSETFDDIGVTQAVDELLASGAELIDSTDTLAVVRLPANSLLEV